MSSANKDKGSRWERAVRDYLNVELGHYWPDWKARVKDGQSPFRNVRDLLNVRKPRQEHIGDVGDLHAYPFLIQNKDVSSSSIPKWLGQAREQAQRAGLPLSCVAYKVRGKGPAAGRVLISNETYSDLGELLIGCRVPRYCRGYWEWTVAEFADVIRVVREGIRDGSH